MWTSLETVKVIVGALVPLSVAGLGLWIARVTRRLEASQWANQKLTEKRIAFVDEVVYPLNDLYCYFSWVGGWKEQSPEDVVRHKRETDRAFHARRPFLTAECVQAWDRFSDTLFHTFANAGENALLRTTLTSLDGDRRKAYPGTWSPSWDAMFVTDVTQVRPGEVRARYGDLVDELGRLAGVAPTSSTG